MNLPRVATIVLNWNKPHDTILCLKSLRTLTYPNHQVLVIDNGSQDNSLELLSEFIQSDPQITLLPTGDNLGFSGGINYGIASALQTDTDYFWLLNNDTEVDPHCLSALIKGLEESPQAAIAGSRVLLYDPINVLWHAGAAFAPLTGQPRHRGMGAPGNDPQYLQNAFVEYVTGCSLLISRSAIEQVGVLDDRFYLYYEEADLCYRVRDRGWQILYVADSILWHRVAGSSTGLPARTYYEVRNRLLFTRKHRPLALSTVLAYLIFQEILKPWLKGKTQTARSGFAGLVDFLRGKFGRREEKG